MIELDLFVLIDLSISNQQIKWKLSSFLIKYN